MCGAPVQAMQEELREAVLVAERALLYALGFELTVLHPFKIALDLAGQSAGFGLNLYTTQRNGVWDLYQVIFNLTNLRCATPSPYKPTFGQGALDQRLMQDAMQGSCCLRRLIAPACSHCRCEQIVGPPHRSQPEGSAAISRLLANPGLAACSLQSRCCRVCPCQAGAVGGTAWALTRGCWGWCSLQTTLCAQYRPEQVAVAVVYLALQMVRTQVPPTEGYHWWEHCDASPADLEGALKPCSLALCSLRG